MNFRAGDCFKSGQWFPDGSDGKDSIWNARDPDSIPGWGRSPGEGNGNPLQYSGLENPVDRGACWATVHSVTELDKTEENLAGRHSIYQAVSQLRIAFFSQL